MTFLPCSSAEDNRASVGVSPYSLRNISLGPGIAKSGSLIKVLRQPYGFQRNILAKAMVKSIRAMAVHEISVTPSTLHQYSSKDPFKLDDAFRISSCNFLLSEGLTA